MSCEECVNWPPSAMGNKPCCFCYPDTPMNYFQRKEEQKDMGNTEFTEKAKELLGCVLFGMEEDGKKIPAPSSLESLHMNANERSALIDVYMPAIRRSKAAL